MAESEMDEEVGGVWIVGNVEELEDEEMMLECRERREVGKGTCRKGCRIECWTQISADQCHGFSKIREDRRDGFSKIHADQGDGFGFYSRRGTCKCQEEADETKNARRNNRFFALASIESEQDEEVNAVEAVQEIVEITVDSGAAKKVSRERSRRGQ